MSSNSNEYPPKMAPFIEDKNSKIDEVVLFNSFDEKDKNSKFDEAACFTGFNVQAMPKFKDGDKELGICVRSDKFNDLLYTIILHRDYGEFVVRDVQIDQGAWLLFTPTDEVFFIECQYKKLAAHDIEQTQPRRRCIPIPGWTHPKTFRVEVFVNNIVCRFNEQFNMCMDAILGKVLVGDDSFINKALKAGETISLAVTYMHNFATGIHWVAIGVNQPKLGETYYRQIKQLPRNVKMLADLCYEEDDNVQNK